MVDRRSTMRNNAMRQKLTAHEAIDVSDFPKKEGVYVLPHFTEGKDYCDAQTEQWIWSIGRNLKDGTILASTDSRFYQNPEFECLWLR
jgi:hypothetical protein